MIKKLFTYIALMISLAACSDDIFNAPLDELPSNGELSVNFAVPDMYSVSTRADGDYVSGTAFSAVRMLVFDSNDIDDAKLVQDELLTADKDSRNIEIIIKDTERKNANLFFLFVANSKITGLTVGSTKLKDVLANIEVYNDGTNMVLSGAASLSSLLKYETVQLYRNVAKVGVTVTGTHENNPNGYAFQAYSGYDENPSSFAGTNKSFPEGRNYQLGAPGEATTEESSFGDELLGKEIVMTPVSNTGSDYGRSFIIVKGKFNGKDYYYRLDYQKKDDDGNIVQLDILPNHSYEFKIEGDPKAAGCKTPSEAVKNPVALDNGEMSYTVEDHTPEIFNMISDGVRELGVSHECRKEGSEVGTATFYVEIYCGLESASDDYDDFKANYKKYISFSENWLTATGISEITNPQLFGKNRTQGKVYEITVNFAATSATGLIEETATVNWMGLSRDVAVIWDRDFDPSELYSSVELTMENGGLTKTTVSDYWGFISGTNADGSAGNIDVWGTSIDANNGEARDQGLHFPMPYGTDDRNLAQYTYTVKLKKLGAEGETYDWRYELKGDAAITEGVNVTTSSSSTLTNVGPEFIFDYKNLNSYTYGTGYLSLQVKRNNKYEEVATIPMYHTGFFYKDNTSNLSDISKPETGRNWTYYEVCSLGGKHWLDRNLGAHSAEMYIESSGDVTYMGNSKAAGGYYRVADYKKYDKPIMRSGICPPGYDYPTNADYNDLRASSSFSTATVGSYNEARYATESYSQGKQKMVYFPKCRYVADPNGGNGSESKQGESRAGYYWTSTAGTGLEKEEVGAWLKCFQLTGAATTYINGEVYCSSTSTTGNYTRTGTIKGYAMPVRCVASDSHIDTSNPQRTYFFVEGATHAYLYTLDEEGHKQAITTWPGIAITTYNSATLGKVYEVAYESAVNTTDKLYVIFNYKDDKGKIWSMSKDTGNAKLVRITDTLGAVDLTGWNFNGEDAPDYNNYGTGTMQTGNGTSWVMNLTAKTGGIKTAGHYETVTTLNTYRIYVKEWGDMNGMNIWGSYGPTINKLFTDSDGYTKETINGTDYYYYEFKHDDAAFEVNYESRNNNYYDDDHKIKFTNEKFKKESDGVYYVCISGNSISDVTGGKPGGTTEVTYSNWRVKGLIFGKTGNEWNSQNLTKEGSSNVWKGTFTLSNNTGDGSFMILADGSDGKEYEFNRESSSTQEDLTNGGNNIQTATPGNGNFKITGTGNYTFSFNAETKKLTVTKMVAETVTYSNFKVKGQILTNNTDWTTDGSAFTLKSGTSDVYEKTFTSLYTGQFVILATKTVTGGSNPGTSTVQFKSSASSTYNISSSGVTNAGTKEHSEDDQNGSNFYLQTAGSYTISFNATNKTLTVKKEESGPTSKDYRIYFPNTFTCFWFWFKKDGDSSDTHLFKNSSGGNISGLNTNQKEGNYYYADFTHTGDEAEILKYSGGGTNDNKSTGKTLGDFTAQTIDGKTVYCAYIDSSNVFHAGKPAAVVTPTWDGKSYRVYVKKWQPDLSKFNCWYKGGNAIVNGELTNTSLFTKVTINSTDYYYFDFTNSGTFTLYWQPGYPNYGDQHEFASSSFVYDSSVDKKCAYATAWDTMTGGKPSGARRKTATVRK